MKKTLLTLYIFHFSFFVLYAQGVWSPRASFPALARTDAISFSVGKYGYIGLGDNVNSSPWSYHDLWQFNPSTNTWVQKANFPGLIRFNAATFVIGHKAYIVTGYDSDYDALTECWEYDANADTWTQKNNFPGHERGAAVGFAIGNKGFIGTGIDTIFYNDIWEYDTASDTWTQKANFPGIPRYYASSFAVGGSAYICFGAIEYINAGIFTNDIWKYDTASDTWTQKTTYPAGISLQCLNGFVIGNNIYIGIGQDSTAKCYQWFWKYNTLNDTWTQQASFPGAPRDLASSFAIGDTGYLGSGTDQNPFYYGDFYKFYPDTLTSIENMESPGIAIAIYPNPNNGVFHFVITNPPELTKQSLVMAVYNALGEKVYSSPIQTGDNLISPGNEPNGIYLYKVINQQGNILASGKFIIQ